MPRKTLVTKSSICVRVPDELMESVRTRLTDPVTGKTRFGGVSDLIESLLREWVRNQEPKK